MLPLVSSVLFPNCVTSYKSLMLAGSFMETVKVYVSCPTAVRVSFNFIYYLLIAVFSALCLIPCWLLTIMILGLLAYPNSQQASGLSTSREFFKTAREAQLPLKCQNFNGQICTIVLTFYWLKCIRIRSSRRRVGSELADSISFSYIPVTSQCISLLKPSVRWLQWDWINAPIMSRPRTLSVSGGQWSRGLAWTLGFCVMVGGSVEGLYLLLIDSDFVL